MKFLLSSPPLTRHLDPLLVIGCLLWVRGHEVAVTADSFRRAAVEASGGRPSLCHPARISPPATWNLCAPALSDLPSLPELMTLQARALLNEADAASVRESASVDVRFPSRPNRRLGILECGSRPCVPAEILHCGISVLVAGRDGAAPFALELPPLTNHGQLAHSDRDRPRVSQLRTLRAVSCSRTRGL